MYSNLGAIRGELHEWKAAEAIYRQAIDLGKRLVRDHPNVLDYRTRLATSYHNQGNTLREQDQARLAVASYDAALDVLHSDRGRPEAHLDLRNTYWDRAIARGRLGQHAAAIQDWQQAIDFDEGPTRASIRLFQETARMERRLEQTQGNAAGLPALLYEAARTYARALPAAAKEEDALIEPYGKRALELLQQAQKAGLFKDRRKVTELKNDKDIQPLRQRRDFQDFMKRLEQ